VNLIIHLHLLPKSRGLMYEDFPAHPIYFHGVIFRHLSLLTTGQTEELDVDVKVMLE
jgi:hypothetical protein